MGFWSDNIGGGNSFSQSVSNATTPNDGNTYVGGQATSTVGRGSPQDDPSGPPDEKAVAYEKAAAENAARVSRLRAIAADSGVKNSVYQSTLNRLTPNDGKEYIGGDLVRTNPIGTTLSSRGVGNAPGMFGVAQKGFARLGGARDGDPAVGLVDGQTIYERSDGQTYSVNAIGLPYDTVSAESTKAKMAEDSIASLMNPSSDYFRGEATNPLFEMLEDSAEDDAPVQKAIDPCPKGFTMDATSKVCVIDFAPVKPLAPATPTPLSTYTSVSPMSLSTLNPGQQAPFTVPPATAQPITIAQQGLASLLP